VIVSTVLYSVEKGTSIFDGLPYLLFLNSFSGIAERMFPYTIPWWSLATEVQFYLLLPWIGAPLLSRSGRIVLAAATLLYVAAYAHAASSRFTWGPEDLTGRLPAFAIGMITSWIYLNYGEALRVRLHAIPWARRGLADLALLVTLLALGFLLRGVVARGFFQAEFYWHAWHVAEALLRAMVVLIILVAPLRSAAFFRQRWLVTVGVLSYSLYLLHLPILFYGLYPLRARIPVEGWTLASLALVAGCLLASLAASTLTYLTIERPFLRRKTRVAD
jgi:peptidoglycan/LPS O-acetylase OafA/YrhL